MKQIKVELVDHMGTDLSVVNAARVSFDKESKWCLCEGEDEHGIYLDNCLCETDQKLVNYLAKHDHWTPFGHTSISLRVAAPVPIRTQCFKHKIGFVENEESRRYISSTPEIFIPEFREKPDGSIKQGSGGEHPYSENFKLLYEIISRDAVKAYEAMIDNGVAPEQARFILPQGAIVNWIWTGNLVSFANFYKKRIDPHAQQEIQEVARKVDEVIRPLFPVAWSALVDGE